MALLELFIKMIHNSVMSNEASWARNFMDDTPVSSWFPWWHDSTCQL